MPAGLEQRYLLPALPSVLCLAAASLTCLPPKRQQIVAAIAAVLILVQPFGGAPSPKRFTGFAPAAALLADSPPGAKFLVVSDARGEGAFITEVALRDSSRPSRMVKRGSKILATSDWLGRDYETVFDDEEELAAFLAQTDLAAIVIDEGIPEIFRRSYHDLIHRVLASGATPYTEVLAIPSVRSSQASGESRVLVYKRLHP